MGGGGERGGDGEGGWSPAPLSPRQQHGHAPICGRNATANSALPPGSMSAESGTTLKSRCLGSTCAAPAGMLVRGHIQCAVTLACVWFTSTTVCGRVRGAVVGQWWVGAGARMARTFFSGGLVQLAAPQSRTDSERVTGRSARRAPPSAKSSRNAAFAPRLRSPDAEGARDRDHSASARAVDSECAAPALARGSSSSGESTRSSMGRRRYASMWRWRSGKGRCSSSSSSTHTGGRDTERGQ